VSFEIWLISLPIESDAAGLGLVTAVGIMEAVVEVASILDNVSISVFPHAAKLSLSNNFFLFRILALSTTTFLRSSKSGSAASTS